MEIRRVTLNGKTGDASAAKEWIRALNDPWIVTEKSGFLFKASFDEDHLMLAVAPALIHGERTMHYNLHPETENGFTLIGDVNAQGFFTLLFKPDNLKQLVAEPARFVEVCRRFAGFLLENGYTGEGRIDEVTQGILKELGLSSAPQVLADL